MTIDTRSRLWVASVLGAGLLVASACGGDSPTSTGEPSSTTVGVTTTSEPPETNVPADPTTTPAPPETSEQPTSTVDDQVPDDELPGDAFELAPPAGRVLAVVGVRHDDVLNVRLAPGTDNPIVAELDPLADDLVASGRARALTRTIWWEITTATDVVGWVNASYTAQLGPTFDLTSRVVEEVGSIPEAETMPDLGLLVADALRGDPDVPSEVVLTVPPSVGDLGEATHDLIGLGDDAVRGLRLHVFGQPLESGDGFALKAVESTDLCDPVRGVSEPEGLCA